MKRHRHRKHNRWSFKPENVQNRIEGERSRLAGWSLWERSLRDHICDKMEALSAPSEQMRIYYGSAFSADDYRAMN